MIRSEGSIVLKEALRPKILLVYIPQEMYRHLGEKLSKSHQSQLNGSNIMCVKSSTATLLTFTQIRL